MSRPLPEGVTLDETLFRKHLAEEMKLLEEWFREGKFTEKKHQAGFETEYFLINSNCELARKNLELISHLGFSRMVPEMDESEVEINSDVFTLENQQFSLMHHKIVADYMACLTAAKLLDLEILSIGTLPNSKEIDYTEDTHTHTKRYDLLTGSVPPENVKYLLQIGGNEEIKLLLPMFKGHGISFQIHFRLDYHESVRHFNAAIVLAAPILAACTNSPFICGKHIAAESRVFYYENMWKMSSPKNRQEPLRCTLSKGYVDKSLMELFSFNADHYHTLMPVVSDHSKEELNHVLMHNGCIYHWVRPIIDFGPSGIPHLRVEFRPLSSGPTHVDMVANAALFFGLVRYFAMQEQPIEHLLPFKIADQNFHKAAMEGLGAKLLWIDGTEISAADLILERLLPRAYEGLCSLNADADDALFYLKIIESRVMSGINGSQWQLNFIEKHPGEFEALVRCYLKNQLTDLPVHLWQIP